MAWSFKPAAAAGLLLAAAISCAAHPSPASSLLSIEAGGTWQQFAEYTEEDQRLVREHGLMPTLAFNAAWQADSWGLRAEILASSGSVVYDGQTQAGTPFHSDTELSLWRVSTLAQWQFDAQFSAALGAYLAGRERSIIGSPRVRGLQESYRSQGLILALAWQPSQWPGITTRVEFQHALAGQQRVDFLGAYDDAKIDSGHSQGLRWRTRSPLPFAAPSWGLVLDIESTRSAASAVSPLQRQGRRVGSVQQARSTSLGAALRLEASW